MQVEPNQQPQPLQPGPPGYQPPAPGFQQPPPPGWQPQPQYYPQPMMMPQQQQQQQQQSTSVVVNLGESSCEHNISSNFTCCGILCCLFFFPLGLICCFLWREEKCTKCGRRF